MNVPLTSEERDAMAHCIGHHSAKGCSVKGGRNHYVTEADDTMWCALVIRGLATSRELSFLPEGQASFSLTEAGRRAVEADPRSRRPTPDGREYTVWFRCFDSGITVHARTRGQARYRAASEVAEAWNMTAHEALTEVRRCWIGGWP